MMGARTRGPLPLLAVMSALLAAGVTASPAQQSLPSQQQTSDPLTALQQLTALLEPAVERAVTRAQASRQQDGLLSRLGRLETVVGELASQQRTGRGAETSAGPAAQPQPPPADCLQRPSPLPADQAPHEEPAHRACARSCLQLRDQTRRDPLPDGVYWMAGKSVPVYCDFSHDGGGWTLLVTSVSRDGWSVLAALARDVYSPSLTDNYSILGYADAIRDLGKTGKFAYRIEGQAQKGRQRWGGVWFAPRSYSFRHEKLDQTDVSLVRRFDRWDYKDTGIEKRMPWLNTGARGGGTAGPILTTSNGPVGHWWGTIITHPRHPGYSHSPWIVTQAHHSGTVLYWMREEDLQI